VQKTLYFLFASPKDLHPPQGVTTPRVKQGKNPSSTYTVVNKYLSVVNER
jgi:hypothetical protein